MLHEKRRINVRRPVDLRSQGITDHEDSELGMDDVNMEPEETITTSSQYETTSIQLKEMNKMICPETGNTIAEALWSFTDLSTVEQVQKQVADYLEVPPFELLF